METNEIAIKTATEVPPIVAEVRKYAEDGYKLSVMTASDRTIISAATGQPIADFDKAALVGVLMQMLTFIAIDVGYKKPSEPTEWTYIVTRIAEILCKYHRDITIMDIKAAFEMLIVGELDAFLPRNGNGEPDRSHYQSFNAEYINKILAAYKKRQGMTIKKAREVQTNQPKALPAAEPQGWDKKGITRRVYDEYVKTKRLNFNLREDVIVYEYLCELGLIEKVEVTDEDKNIAYNRYLIQADLGYRNGYEARWVRRAGINAREIQPLAYTVAIHRAIKKCFQIIEQQQADKDKDDVSRKKTEIK